MSSAFYVYHIAVVDRRADISVLYSYVGQGEEHVELCKSFRRRTYSHGGIVHLIPYAGEDLVFEGFQFILRAENCRFHVFKLVRYVSFLVGERLFSYVSLGHFVGSRARNFDVVSENAVVAYFQLLYSGLFPLVLLGGFNPVLAV